jgi:predicted dehydrogenase
MEKVRIGIIGIGGVGTNHAKKIAGGEVPGGELTAVCSTNPNRVQWARENLGENVRCFDTVDALLASDTVDAVLIATPHYDHPGTAIRCFRRGLHVLVEKPAGVFTRQVREMNEVAAASGKVFGIMYDLRTTPVYQKLRDLVRQGELGELKRTHWIITSYYRPQSYYDSGGWRGTWAGEGGGVLINQDAHQLDLWQWTCGMPKRVRAFMSYGKYHAIEVEDDVTAYVEYENGATGVFVTSTGDAPGTNRLEVTGDRGKIVIEDDRLTFWRLTVSERQFNQDFKGGSGGPECWKCEVPVKGTATRHQGIMGNWVEAIQMGVPLLAPGPEGLNGLQLSNAMHLSAWTDRWVDLPVDEDWFEEQLRERIRRSAFNQTLPEALQTRPGTGPR